MDRIAWSALTEVQPGRVKALVILARANLSAQQPVTRRRGAGPESGTFGERPEVLANLAQAR